MRILLDENVPADLAKELAPHSVTTVHMMRWSSIQNGALLLRAAHEFDVLLTIDRSMQHQQVVPRSIALLTLRVPNNRLETVLPMAPRILAALEHCAPGTSTTVVSD